VNSKCDPRGKKKKTVKRQKWRGGKQLPQTATKGTLALFKERGRQKKKEGSGEKLKRKKRLVTAKPPVRVQAQNERESQGGGEKKSMGALQGRGRSF